MGFRPAGLQEYERLQHSRCCAIRDPRWWWCPFNMALKWVLGRPLESHKSHEGENHQMGSNSRITTVHNEGCLPLHMLLRIPWAENSFDHSPQTSELQIKIKGCPKYYVRRVTRDRVIWRLWNYNLFPKNRCLYSYKHTIIRSFTKLPVPLWICFDNSVVMVMLREEHGWDGFSSCLSSRISRFSRWCRAHLLVNNSHCCHWC